ncbi:MucR family transcriptional regulator [Pseudooceanicola nanhaiensis]|uniref:MucR family transcriptional regulator n=1 Tax=Pseudooceanicola nanhaiensis TaxID=375761 RepID=UPI004058CA33
MKNILRRVMDWLGGSGTASAGPAGPAPGVGRSYLQCLETGVRKPVLHRHIRQTLGMTPEQYREKWGLPADYPMVSEAYAERRDAVRSKKSRA